MRRKLQQSLLNNNPFPSLRNNEETFFSLSWHRENNISDLCCLVIQSLYQLGLFSCWEIWTLRAECGSILSGEFPPPIFICIDCELFHQKNRKKENVLEEPVTELMCWSISSGDVSECVHFGSGTENICWNIPGEGKVLTDSLRVRVPPALHDSDSWCLF